MASCSFDFTPRATEHLTERVIELLQSESPGEWAGYFVVVTETRAEICILKPRNKRKS